MKLLKQQNGYTLVEVIAAFVLIMIIITSFLTIFLTSKNTISESKITVNATYTAQTEMEAIYNKMQVTTVAKQAAMMEKLGYSLSCNATSGQTYTKKQAAQQETIIVYIKKHNVRTTLNHLLVTVYDAKKSIPACYDPSIHPKSQMENIVKVGAAS